MLTSSLKTKLLVYFTDWFLQPDDFPDDVCRVAVFTGVGLLYQSQVLLLFSQVLLKTELIAYTRKILVFSHLFIAVLFLKEIARRKLYTQKFSFTIK